MRARDIMLAIAIVVGIASAYTSYSRGDYVFSALIALMALVIIMLRAVARYAERSVVIEE